MDDRSHSRRSVLQASAGVVAAATTSGLAGCSAIPGLGGGGTSGSKRIENWAFVPGEVADQGSYTPYYRSYDAVRGVEDELADVYYHRIEEDYRRQYQGPLDVDFDDARWTVTLGDCKVIRANHTVDDVVDNLTDESDFEEADDVHGYTTVVGPEDRYGYAIDGSTILSAFGIEDAADALENLIDTQNGEIAMTVDENEVFVDALDPIEGDFVFVDSVDLGGKIVGRGRSATFEGETTTVQTADVYEDEEEYDEAEIREWASENDDVSASFHGRVVVSEDEWDTDEYGV